MDFLADGLMMAICLGRSDQMFGKGSKERELFAEFYKICEKYWLPEAIDNKAWWDEMWEATDEFRKKYETEDKFAAYLVIAFRDRLKNLTSNQKTLGV